ncbi:MAG TPA: TonB family protein, partial [Polyangiaceae bacterium]|nr:TonB family protein [Polyangiaceae bacterium]
MLSRWPPITVVCAAALGATVAFAQDDRGQGAVPSGNSGAVTVPQPPAQQAPPKSGLTPPQLTKFVAATYPAEAAERKLEGNVVLQLDIDASGRVAAVAVVNPAGHGFDEAAAEAARRFEFAPA